MKIGRKNINLILLIFILIIPFPGMNSFAQKQKKFDLVNTSHLDYLYQKISVNGKEMGIIHIYADYPDYKYVEAKGEGIACVDDAARAEIFYIEYFRETHDKNVLNKIKGLTNFLIYMQSKSGFFYNFIWNDFTKDTTYKTSVAEPNWWSWRAIWALGKAQILFSRIDKPLAAEIKLHLDKAVSATLSWLKSSEGNGNKEYGGIDMPNWLPYGSAADQSALLVIGLSDYYRITKDENIRNTIERLCKGIMEMQAGSKNEFPYGVFLSWENTWHMWGNSQSDALMQAWKLFKKPAYLKAAGKEIDNFYPYLIHAGYFNDFTLEKKGAKYAMKDTLKYSQIAYGIRPIVFAALAFSKATGDNKAAETAAEAGMWLLGKNIAGTHMYNPETGVCYDGIISATEINKNSGAESTIEALLSLFAIEKNPHARKLLMKYYNSRK